MNNLVTLRGPHKDSQMFFGRVDALHEITDFLRGSQSVSLIGPSKIGKTSLLFHLMQRETRLELGIDESNLFVYVDCEALSGDSPKQVFQHFLLDMAIALNGHTAECEPLIEHAFDNPDRMAIEGVLRSFNQRGLQIVLMLDHFEGLGANSNVDVDFFNTLRSIAGRHRVVYVTASARSLIELTYADRSQKTLSSPFFNIFAPTSLGLLSEQDTHILVRETMEVAGLPVTPEFEGFVYELSGGHPLVIQTACICSCMPSTSLTEIECRVLQRLERHFLEVWHGLSVTEHDVLWHVSGAVSRDSDDATARIALRNLVQKCLLVRDG